MKPKPKTKSLVVKTKTTALALPNGTPGESTLQWTSVTAPIISKTQFDILTERTPAWALRTRPGRGGKDFTYVPWGYVLAKMNQAFGFGWSFKLLPIGTGGALFELKETAIKTFNKKGIEVTTPKYYIAVAGELTVEIRDPKNPAVLLTTIVKTGFGSSEWFPEVELGDMLKSARSDAFKTCALLLGIASDLYFDTEAQIERFDTIQRNRNAAPQFPAAESMTLTNILPFVSLGDLGKIVGCDQDDVFDQAVGEDGLIKIEYRQAILDFLAAKEERE